MIKRINDLSAQVAGFRMSGDVTKEEYDNTVFPVVKQIADTYNEVNLIMVLDTDVKNYTAGAWMDDAILGVKHLTQWNKIAIVSDENLVKTGTAVMDKIAPGTYKAFAHKDEAIAFNWINEPVVHS